MPAHHTAAATAKPKLRRNGPLHLRVAGNPGLVRVVASGDVVQLPAAYAADGRLYVCPVDATAPGTCPHGTACADVHLTAVSHAAPRTYNAHERQADWKAMSDVPVTTDYSFYPATLGDITVAPPNAKTAEAATAVPAHMCLKTAALDAARSPLSHCAHFRAKGVCDLGARCMFIHALESLTPAAVATPPHAMPCFANSAALVAGDEEDESASASPFGSITAMPPRRHAAASTPTAAEAIQIKAQAAALHTAMPPRASTTPKTTRRHNPYGASLTAQDDEAFGPSMAVSISGTPDESPAFAWCGPRNGFVHLVVSASAPSPSSQKRRFRHDPYSAHGYPIWGF